MPMSLCTYPWVLNLDADETLSDSFIQELESVLFNKITYVASTLYQGFTKRWGRHAP